MEGDINGEGQNISKGGFVKILASGGDPPSPPPTRGNPGKKTVELWMNHE